MTGGPTCWLFQFDDKQVKERNRLLCPADPISYKSIEILKLEGCFALFVTDFKKLTITGTYWL